MWWGREGLAAGLLASGCEDGSLEGMVRWRAEDGSQRLGGLDELLGSNGIVLVGVDGDVDEGALESVGVEEGAARGNNGSRHDGGVELELGLRW